MSSLLSAAKRLLCVSLALVFPVLARGQTVASTNGGQYAIAGALPGDQSFPHVSIGPSGGYLVWQDNVTDGDGLGVSTRRLDSSLSGSLGENSRVNEQGDGDQEKPQVTVLNNRGAAFVWQGGKQGFQDIYVRFRSPSSLWVTGDILANTYTNGSQINPRIACLVDGSVVVAWSSADQDGSLQGIYAQRFSQEGQKMGGEFRINVATLFNQRSPALAALDDGNFAVAWISEQQRFENSVDVYVRRFSPSGDPLGGEILANSSTNLCSNPSLAPSPGGGFLVLWGQKALTQTGDGWDVYGRPFSNGGLPGAARRVNTHVYGDQYAPSVSALGAGYLAVWTSLGQDGSREGVYGQFLKSDGSPDGPELRINTTTVSQQIQPVVASDRSRRFLVAWSSFGGGVNSFDLFAQRYETETKPLDPPDAPFVSALSSSRLSVTWPLLAGFDVASYELYIEGVATPVSLNTNMWTLGGLPPNSTRLFRLGYVLADARISPLSDPGSGRTWGEDDNSDGLPDDWQKLYWGSNSNSWPSPSADSDGDGASNRDEFQAGTSPTDPNSVLRTRLVPTEQGIFLSWNTQPGLMYQVQSSIDVSSWANLGSPRFAAGSTDSIPVGGDSSVFYRLIRLR